MTTTQYVLYLCKYTGIPVSKLEKACGFSNGYLKRLMGNLPEERLRIVASVLEVNYDELSSKDVKEIKNSVINRLSNKTYLDLNDISKSLLSEKEGHDLEFTKIEKPKVEDLLTKPTVLDMQSFNEFEIPIFKSYSMGKSESIQSITNILYQDDKGIIKPFDIPGNECNNIFKLIEHFSTLVAEDKTLVLSLIDRLKKK